MEGRGFDTRWGEFCFFSVFLNLPAAPSLEFTQTLTEMSTRNRRLILLGSWAQSVRRADNLSPPSVCRLSIQCGILNMSQPYRPPWPVMDIAFFFYYITYIQPLSIKFRDLVCKIQFQTTFPGIDFKSVSELYGRRLCVYMCIYIYIYI
jgi:hypothetical protein